MKALARRRVDRVPHFLRDLRTSTAEISSDFGFRYRFKPDKMAYPLFQIKFLNSYLFLYNILFENIIIVSRAEFNL